MRDVTILPSEKIVGEKALEIFNKMGISCEITDFSVLLGGYSSKTSDTRSKSMGWWWTSTCTKDTSSHVAPEFVDFYPINIATVFEGNRLGESPANSTNRGVRPAIKYSLIQPICKVKINKYGVKETLYGDYPQTLVDDSLSSTLEKLYKSNDLKKTGKHYSIKSENLDLVSKSDSLDEFDYNNERYVRFAPHLPIGPVETLSNGKKIISDKGYWIHVEPIKWFIDEKEDIALCEKIMFSGHSFSEEKGNKEIKFENTEIFKFLNKKFVKEIASKQLKQVKKETTVSKSRKKVEDMISAAKNPNTKKTVLEHLADFDDFEVKKAVISNSKCTGIILKKIYKNISERYTFSPLQYDIIMHPNCPLEDIVDYYKDYIKPPFKIHGEQITEVRNILDKLAEIIKNPDCPPSILIKLGESKKKTSNLRFEDDVDLGTINDLTKKEKNIARIAKYKLAKKKIHNITNEKEEVLVEEKATNQEKKGLETIKDAQRKEQERLEEARKQILSNLKQIKELVNELCAKGIDDKIKHIPRIAMPRDELIIDCIDHYEINPVYMQYIDYIDFSFIDTTNLKVSGIDWCKTNISINPQTVYNKDLSNAKFNDKSIISK